MLLPFAFSFIAAFAAFPQDSKPSAPRQPDPGGVREKLAAIEVEFSTVQEDFYKKYQDIKSKEEQAAYLKNTPKAAEYISKAWEIIHKNPKDPGVIVGLNWIIAETYAPGGADFTKALDLVAADFIDSKEASEICSQLQYSPIDDARKFLETVLSRSKLIEIRASACSAIGGMCMNRANTVDYFNSSKDKKEYAENYIKTRGQEAFDKMSKADSAALRVEAEKYYEQVIKEFGAVASQTKFAEGALFEIRNLSNGRQAPEIVGKDVDNKEMKLSDFKGKVVVLDFWGYW
ncbi:MAG: redoxin domain-containing protein [Planctomycetes bacterium]|nr:redoxin domain-containing protein [Planctomycetota bacterium]